MFAEGRSHFSMPDGYALSDSTSGESTISELSRSYYAVLLRYFARRGVPLEDAQDSAWEGWRG